ncbi:DMT family transporter [Actinomadura rugatobispora]|uniref:DMT family transporter n=1 Tax=Actinomadura rugatobispora TaxID=1994 RepID=A0ABW1A971_9ACTN|nr:multidrug efflux SMR transporter [Actinomadura rugatobispora]
MGWLYLAIAVAGDAAGTYALKRSQGLRRPWFGVAAVGAYGLALWTFAVALRTIPTSVADASFAAVGTLAVALTGVLFLDERANARKIAGMTCIVVGVVALRLGTGAA